MLSISRAEYIYPGGHENPSYKKQALQQIITK
jgi:hypothetical protein